MENMTAVMRRADSLRQDSGLNRRSLCEMLAYSEHDLEAAREALRCLWGHLRGVDPERADELRRTSAAVRDAVGRMAT